MSSFKKNNYITNTAVSKIIANVTVNNLYCILIVYTGY